MFLRSFRRIYSAIMRDTFIEEKEGSHVYQYIHRILELNLDTRYHNLSTPTGYHKNFKVRTVDNHAPQIQVIKSENSCLFYSSHFSLFGYSKLESPLF